VVKYVGAKIRNGELGVIPKSLSSYEHQYLCKLL